MPATGSGSTAPERKESSGTRPTRRAWTPKEEAHLKERFGIDSDSEIAVALDRSVAGVRQRAAELFDSAAERARWSAEDLETLRAELGSRPLPELARLLGRSPAEVEAKLSDLDGGSRSGGWSSDEVQRFKRLYGRRTDRDLARSFQRTPEAIRRMARHLALAKDKAFLRRLEGANATRMPRWSSEELERLVELYPNTPNLDIAHRLGRSVKSVVSKAHHMGLKKCDERLREMGRQNVALRRDR